MRDERFYVDERVGCIAVRERVGYGISPGLHHDLPDVVAYWSGFSEEGENGISWNIHGWQREKAKKLCALLNGPE